MSLWCTLVDSNPLLLLHIIPPHHPRRRPDRHAKVGYILSHHRVGADDTVLADGDIAEDADVLADVGAGTDRDGAAGGQILRLYRLVGILVLVFVVTNKDVAGDHDVLGDVDR